MPKLEALAGKNDDEFFGHMTPSEKEALTDAMRDIVRRRGLKSVPIK